MSDAADDADYEQYCAHAMELPLLTDEELRLFVVEGEEVVVRPTGLRKSWSSPLDTQFLIRLRRTLCDRLNRGSGSNPP